MGHLKKVTLDDVANEVGLSRFLVCRALTGKPGVNEETRRRVQETAIKLGYKGRKVGKSPNTQVMSAVLLIDEAEADRIFWSKIIRGIEAAARNYGCELLLRAVSVEEVEKGEIPSMILEGRAKGVFVTGNFSADYVARFEKVDCQVVLVDNFIPATKHDAILIADWEGSYLVTKHLIDLGHRQLGYAGQISGHWSWTQRFQGFLTALQEHGLFFDHQQAIGQKNGFKVWGTEYMSRELKKIKDMPTAWVCNNDLTAHYLIDVLKHIGQNIPKDVSVVGFDDLPEEIPEIQGLTTVRVFGQEMGKAAFGQLLWRLANRDAQPRRVMVGVQFVEGITAAPPGVK